MKLVFYHGTQRKFLVPCEQNNMKGQNGDEMSLEETVLRDLKTVTTQASNKINTHVA